MKSEQSFELVREETKVSEIKTGWWYLSAKAELSKF
jgi:hypothetical protein